MRNVTWNLQEAKLPKGQKWTDSEVITKKNANLILSKMQFYPIGDELYIKGVGYRIRKDTGKREILTVILPNYKSKTASQVHIECNVPVIMQSTICDVWRELGLRQGFATIF